MKYNSILLKPPKIITGYMMTKIKPLPVNSHVIGKFKFNYKRMMVANDEDLQYMFYKYYTEYLK